MALMPCAMFLKTAPFQTRIQSIKKHNKTGFKTNKCNGIMSIFKLNTHP